MKANSKLGTFRFIAAAVMLVLFLAGGAVGCAQHPDAATTQKVQTIVNKSAVDQATAKANAKLNTFHAQNSPITHPIAAANESVKDLRPFLVLLSIVGVGGWIVCFAFSTALPFLSKLAVCLRWVGILSIASLFALPCLPWGFVLLLLTATGLAGFELYKTRSIVATETVMKTDVAELLGENSASAKSVTLTTSTLVATANPQPAIPATEVTPASAATAH